MSLTGGGGRGDPGNGHALREGVRRRRRVADDAGRPRPRESAPESKKSPCAVSRGRGDLGHVRPAVVEGIADRTAIGARTLIAARQGFTDANKGKVAVTYT